jgi:hypothetical protein
VAEVEGCGVSPEMTDYIFKSVIGSMIAFLIWLLKRQVGQLDAHLSAQDGHLSRQDGKLDGLATKWSEHDRALAVLDMRVSHLEAGEQVRRAEHEQFAGFLQTQGFKRSEGL